MTGFNPDYQDVKASELTATYTVDFSNKKGLFKAFYDTWNGVYDSTGNKWDFDEKNYSAKLILNRGRVLND